MQDVGLVVLPILGTTQPRSVDAEPAAGISRIGILNPQGVPPSIEEGLRNGLRKLNHVEGKNAILEWRRGACTQEPQGAIGSGLTLRCGGRAQQLRCWVPVALRARAPGHAGRWASSWT